jgi:hypothetical protein
LNNVDLPTFGKPTMPILKPISYDLDYDLV